MRRRAAAAAAFLVLLLIGSAAACSAGAPEPAAPARAERIVSLAPSLTEILFALGAGDRVVGVTTFCDTPAAALAAVARVGGGLDPNVEVVMSLRPDLIVAPRTVAAARAVEAIRARGVPVSIFEPQTFPELHEAVRELGRMTGRAVEAEALVASMRRDEEAARAIGRSLPRPPRVYLELWRDPLVTAGRAGYLQAVVEAAGGENAFGDVAATTAQVSPESILARDPDVVVLLYEGARDESGRLRTRPGWAGLRAVREGAVIADLPLDLLARPGPRLAAGTLRLAEALRDRAGS